MAVIAVRKWLAWASGVCEDAVALRNALRTTSAVGSAVGFGLRRNVEKENVGLSSASFQPV